MYCRNCGNQVGEGETICDNCGKSIMTEDIQTRNEEEAEDTEKGGRRVTTKLKINRKAALISAAGTLILAILSVWFIVIPSIQAGHLKDEYTAVESAVADARASFDNGIKEITDMSLSGVSDKVEEANKKISELKDKIKDINESSKYSRVKTKRTAADFKLDTFETDIKGVSDSVASLKIIYNQSIDNDKDIKRFEESDYTYGDAIKNFEGWKTKNDTLKQDLLKLSVAKDLEGYKMTLTNAIGSKGSFFASKLNASNADLSAQVALSMMSMYADDATNAYNNAMNSYYLYNSYMSDAKSYLAKAEAEKSTYNEKLADVERYNKQAEASWAEYTNAIGIDLRQSQKSATA